MKEYGIIGLENCRPKVKLKKNNKGDSKLALSLMQQNKESN
jgi:hypothetical protein